MMVSKRLKRFLRKSQTGQSIVILALGMVGLLAIVGIAVDISILFVRFNTLRRAVDSASIAAAGQMRQDRSMGEVGLAARQFIEFHNLDPRFVEVETCHTAQGVDIDPDTVGDQIDETLCTADQRKLVRVTAEIESPTVFLRLLGFTSITLTASAVSETAVLDVVLIMDVSESMLFDTTYEDWTDVGQGYAYVPPTAWQYSHYFEPNPTTSFSEPNTIFAREYLSGTAFVSTDPYTALEEEFWQAHLLGATQGEVNGRLYYDELGPGGNDPTANESYWVDAFVPAGFPAGQVQPRSECRVRFHPYSQSLVVPDDILDLYAANGKTYGSFGGNWGNFVPTYNFYGCCNDPGNRIQDPTIGANGDLANPGDIIVNPVGTPSQAADNDFSDLICEPFRSARDATRLFLERVDFVRGDRVGFVTFDRTAFVIDPDGTNNAQNLTHMIEDRQTAMDTLNRMIGVRADPNFYDWDEFNGGWNGFAQGTDTNGQSVPIVYDALGIDDGFGGNPFSYNDYPVINNCPFQNAAMRYPWSRYATRTGDPGPTLPNGTPIDGSEALWNIMTPDLRYDPWRGPATVYGLSPANSYELWASCRGTNIGAALREGNNALTDPSTSRSEGTVWVMIMLSDGAAGASDPARRHAVPATSARPYANVSPYLTDGTGAVTSPQIYGIAGQYGAFGVCPYGEVNILTGEARFGELTDTAAEGTVVFPFCLDERPETRHFCYPPVPAVNGGDSSVGTDGSYDVGFGPGAFDINYDGSLDQAENARLGRIYDIDVGDYPLDPAIGAGCDLYYDVDDYARDWADFVGHVNDPNSDIEGLPTIFTIGFGLNFDNGRTGPNNPGSCDDNIPDCLGEELLRYIADVGDNFDIDTNYQQDYLDDTFLNGSRTATEYGAPGICEPPSTGAGDLGGYDPGTGDVEFLPPTESCGNYFNAPGEEELQVVFDEIASRMFTRLAG
ncbi:MAG: pilus assembly protein TadG-related protein [Aggregatilineales bacterium]